MVAATPAFWRERAALHRDIAAVMRDSDISSMHLRLAELMEAEADAVERVPTPRQSRSKPELEVRS